MASIKVKFRPSTVAGREGTIYYQITHDRKLRQLHTDYHVFASEWDDKRSVVLIAPKCDRKLILVSICECIRRDVERLTRLVRRFDAHGVSYTADDVVEEYKRYISEYSLFHFMEGIIVKLKQNGKVRTSETYTAALNSFKKFLTGRSASNVLSPIADIMLDSINSELMEMYEAWNRQRGISSNTISFYNRILRAVYNRAVENDVIENRNPFRHVYTGVDKTIKRALPLSIIKEIKALDLSSVPALDYARDMFILSFMLRGMSFIDMAFLRKTDLANGFITYRRRKTGQLLTIEWTKDMQAIIDKYPAHATCYLLPIIINAGTNERYAYRNAGYNINHNLKKIASKVGISIPLTLYVARHSWASAAKAKGIPLSVISEGMGHDSEATTQIYLASLDTSIVDKANSLILSSL